MRRGACRRSSGRLRWAISQADTRNVPPSAQIASDVWFAWKKCSAWKCPSHVGDAGQRGEDGGAEGEGGVRGDEPERVRRRELVGLDDIGHRRVLRRAPHQREDLDRERDEHQADEVVEERQQPQQHGPAEVAGDHHLAAVPTVDQRAADRREHETRAASGRSSRGRCRFPTPTPTAPGREWRPARSSRRGWRRTGRRTAGRTARAARRTPTVRSAVLRESAG